MADLITRLRSRLAFTGRRHPLTHPCAQTCSGYSQGVDDGAYGTSARLQPTLEAVLKVVEAAQKMVNGANLYDGVEAVDEALRGVEEVCGVE